MAVIGPGTGLGVACLVSGSDGSVVIASEGGHATMAATSRREDAVIDYLRRQFGHVSAERVVSGAGLENLYRAVVALDGIEAPKRDAAEITQAALDDCPIARMALELFCAMLGTIAGNVALMFSARGGVYIAGGIAPADRGLHGTIGIPRTIRTQRAFSKLPRSDSVERHRAPRRHVHRLEDNCVPPLGCENRASSNSGVKKHLALRRSSRKRRRDDHGEEAHRNSYRWRRRPGLNSVIKTVAYRSSKDDIEVVGLRRGWEGLTHLELDDPASRRRYLMPLDRENTRTIDRRGGTILHSSRTNPSKMQKVPDHSPARTFRSPSAARGTSPTSPGISRGKCWRIFAALGIEHLIAIGGDDTLGYAAKLDELGVKVMAIPKTMDNDVATRVLHRLLDSEYPRLRRHPAPADDRRFRTSKSVFSASSVATPDLQPSTRRTSPRSAVSSPNTRSISTSLSGSSSRRSVRTRAITR